MLETKKWEWNPDPTETNILGDLRGQLSKFYIIWIKYF